MKIIYIREGLATGVSFLRGITPLKRVFSPFIVIFFLYLIPRILYLYSLSISEVSTYIALDEKIYLEWAEEIAHGVLLRERAFFFSPLYPYTLAPFFAIFGVKLLIPRVINLIFDILSLSSIILISSRIGGKKLALLSSFIYSLYPFSIFSLGNILMEPLLTFLLTSFIFLIILSSERKKNGHILFVSGITIGILCAGRGIFLLVLPFLLLLFPRVFPHLTGRERAKGVVLLLTGTLLPLGSTCTLNYIQERDFVLITSNAGLNFYMGNNYMAQGTYINVDEVDLGQDPYARNFVEESLGKRVKSSEASLFWFKKGLDFITIYPLAALKLLLKKVVLLFNAREISQMKDFYFFRGYLFPFLYAFPFTFGIVVPMAIFGILNQRGKGWNIIQIVLVAHSMGMMPFFVIDRFRLPMVPLLVISASEGLLHLKDTIKARGLFGMRAKLLFLLLLYLFSFSDTYRWIPSRIPDACYDIAIFYIDRGDRNKSLYFLREALDKRPDYRDAHLLLEEIEKGSE